ncbi:MAG: DUF4160 domain-containing protein [Chitinophagaceae bacterium]|nr:DUF4160 domain-containing protein [Chitinophagaceae bacterium]MCZ2395949.1 DUF4160 domain-containing protein [Chitinophagales bacterium]
MPTIFIAFGYRFSFFSNDHDPVHVHIMKGECSARYDVVPHVKLIKNYKFKQTDLRLIENLIEENREIIINRWNEFFKK